MNLQAVNELDLLSFGEAEDQLGRYFDQFRERGTLSCILNELSSQQL
jgi:hypothetical protein